MGGAVWQGLGVGDEMMRFRVRVGVMRDVGYAGEIPHLNVDNIS